jgi:hypothetical protein
VTGVEVEALKGKKDQAKITIRCFRDFVSPVSKILNL